MKELMDKYYEIGKAVAKRALKHIDYIPGISPIYWKLYYDPSRICEEDYAGRNGCDAIQILAKIDVGCEKKSMTEFECTPEQENGVKELFNTWLNGFTQGVKEY